jgi:histidinol-phosphate aminotransferase
VIAPTDTPDPQDALRLIKPAVRAQGAYTLAAPVARHKVNQNEAADDLDPTLKAEILRRVAGQPWHRYPEFTPRSLLERLGAHYEWDPDGILVGNGSNELIQAAMAVSLDRDDAVVAPSPTFSLYRLMAAVLGARYHAVPLGERFRYDMDALLHTSAEAGARVLVLNTPNNPTGSALTRADIARALAETDGLVLADEAYVEFGGETAIPLLATEPRLIVLRTFSKALGLAGLRFGALLAHPAVAREIAKAKLPYNVNLVTLTAAEVALDHADLIRERVRGTVARRERTIAALRELPGLAVHDSAANFFLVRSRQLRAGELFQRLFKEFGILVRDVSSGPGLDECLRISVGTDSDMDAVIAAFRIIHGESA